MKSESKMTEQDMRDLLKQMHKVGSKPHLRRSQKRAMLASIVPQKPLFLQMAPTFAAAVMAGVLIVSGISFAAQPGDLLYGVKRKLEDARTIIQPSYNETLIQKRDNEIENLTKNGADDSKLDIANKEKQEIESRLRSSSSDDASDSSSENTTEDTHTTTPTQSTTTQPKTETESHTTTGGGSTTGGSGTLSARDQCKATLDAQKKAGQTVTSEQYKACDKL